jgi:hypothetical protein
MYPRLLSVAEGSTVDLPYELRYCRKRQKSADIPLRTRFIVYGGLAEKGIVFLN